MLPVTDSGSPLDLTAKKTAEPAVREGLALALEKSPSYERKFLKVKHFAQERTPSNEEIPQTAHDMFPLKSESLKPTTGHSSIDRSPDKLYDSTSTDRNNRKRKLPSDSHRLIHTGAFKHGVFCCGQDALKSIPDGKSYHLLNPIGDVNRNHQSYGTALYPPVLASRTNDFYPHQQFYNSGRTSRVNSDWSSSGRNSSSPVAKPMTVNIPLNPMLLTPERKPPSPSSTIPQSPEQIMTNIDHYSISPIDPRFRDDYLEFTNWMRSMEQSRGRGFNPNMRRQQTDTQNNPKNSDPDYLEKRRKNNEAAKRSRDNRRQKETQLAIERAFYKQKSCRLADELDRAKSELRTIVRNLSINLAHPTELVGFINELTGTLQYHDSPPIENVGT